MIEDKLNMDHYSGQDLYSDGDVEEELLKAVQSGEDLEQCLMKGDSWPFLYHLSKLRENLLDWYGFDKKGSLLEIGAGCGALTGLFCRKTDHVVAIELSKRRSLINAARNQQYDNLTIMLGNFEDIKLQEKFDYVTLIGVFEYSICYINSKTPFQDMLKRVKSLLKPDGKLILSIENKYGLKYFAGAGEDHTGRCFDGLENYAAVDRVRTFSRKTLEQMLQDAGFSDNDFYYPMPDYKLPSEIYSDRRLPSFGSIRGACVSYDRDRYELFNERLVFDSVCEDGMFGELANSFLVISTAGAPCGQAEKTVSYAKYDRLRAPKAQICTKIFSKGGRRYVAKEALRPEAEAHIRQLLENFHKLSDACPPPVPILCNENGRAVFPYIEGEGLDKALNRAIGEKEAFLAAMHDAIDQIYGAYKKDAGRLVPFHLTEPFCQVFGRPDGIQKAGALKCLRVSNVDSILSNFVRQPDGSLVCLDYEWVFDFPIPAEYLIYRTVYYYFSENRPYIQKYMQEEELLSTFGLTPAKARLFSEMDDHFQQYVHGKGRKYCYPSRYEKKTFQIGSNLQGGEGWFLSIVNDIDRLNRGLGEYRRDLVECRVKMHRKSERGQMVQGYLEKCQRFAKNPHKLQKIREKLHGKERNSEGI